MNKLVIVYKDGNTEVIEEVKLIDFNFNDMNEMQVTYGKYHSIQVVFMVNTFKTFHLI